MGAEEQTPFRLSFLGITIHELLRYGYAGLLAFALAGLIDPIWTTARVEQLGKAVVPIAAVVIGAAVYVSYRRLLGEGLIAWLVVQLHKAFDWFCHWFFKMQPISCKYRYLESLGPPGVPYGERRDAFRFIRDARAVGKPNVWDGFYREHSEMHIVYITFFELTIAAIVALLADERTLSGWLVIFAAVFFLMGMFGDIALSRREMAVLRSEEASVLAALKAAKYIPEK